MQSTGKAAVFYIDYEDQQVLQLIGASQTITKNAAKSTSKGFEIELAAKPVQGLELIANYGYTGAAFDEYRDPAAGTVYDDNKVLWFLSMIIYSQLNTGMY